MSFGTIQCCQLELLWLLLLQRASLVQNLGTKAAGAVAAAMLSLSSLSGAALANEFDVVNSPTPELSYYIDDAGVLNKTTKKAINDRLYKLEVCCLY